MKIALDGAGISPGLSGVGRYFQGLLRELIPLDAGIEYTLFLKEEADPGLAFPNLRSVVLGRPGSYAVWQNTRLRRAVLRGGFDFFWSPNYSLPFFLPLPALLTVHDVSWKALPGDYPPTNRCYRNAASLYSFKKAKIIFTDSDFSKTEIVGRAGVAAGKVKRIHLGVDGAFHRATDAETDAFRARHGFSGKKTVGFLGSFFRRRHVPELVAALEIVRRRHPDIVLLLVGENHAVPPGLLGGDPRKVLWRQRLPEGELNAFYSSLSLLLYPSEYEGFGLPPIEALRCGTPSLLLRGSSLTELYGDVALFVDKPEPGLIADAILGFLANEGETRRRLLDSWQERSAYFSWRRAAEEYLRELRGLP